MPGFPFLQNPPEKIVNELIARSAYTGSIVKRPWIRATSYAQVGTMDGLVLHFNAAAKTDDLYGLVSNRSIGKTISGKDHNIDDIENSEIPGIEGLDVSTGGDNGLLWQGTLKTKWASLKQLNYVIPYLTTPGVHIAVEWGWQSSADIYNASIPSSVISVSDAKKYANSPYTETRQKMIDTNGNYGFAVATITNFRITGNETVGYTIETEFLSKGTNLYDSDAARVSEKELKSPRDSLIDAMSTIIVKTGDINDISNNWFYRLATVGGSIKKNEVRAEINKLANNNGIDVRVDFYRLDDSEKTSDGEIDPDADKLLDPYISLQSVFNILTSNSLYPNFKGGFYVYDNFADKGKIFAGYSDVSSVRALSCKPEQCIIDPLVNNASKTPGSASDMEMWTTAGYVWFNLNTVKTIIETSTSERDVLTRLFEIVSESTLGLVDLALVNDEGNKYKIINRKTTPEKVEKKEIKLVFSDTTQGSTYIRVRSAEMSSNLTDYMKSQVFFENKRVNSAVKDLLDDPSGSVTNEFSNNDAELFDFFTYWQSIQDFSTVFDAKKGFSGGNSKWNDLKLPGMEKTIKEFIKDENTPSGNGKIPATKPNLIVEAVNKKIKEGFTIFNGGIDYKKYPDNKFFSTTGELKNHIWKANEELHKNKKPETVGRYPYFGISYDPELDGITGLSNGDIYYAKNLPDKFGSDDTYFFITGIEHSITQADWTTKIKSLIKL